MKKVILYLTLALILVGTASAQYYRDQDFNNGTQSFITTLRRMDASSTGNGTIRRGFNGTLQDGTKAVVYLQMDGATFPDDGSRNTAWTVGGGLASDVVAGGVFGSNNLITDGGNNRLTGNAGADLTGDWSASAWVYPDTGSGSRSWFWNGATEEFFGAVSSNTFYCQGNNGGVVASETYANWGGSTNEYHLMTCQFDSASSSLLLLVDGRLIKTSGTGTDVDLDLDAASLIGRGGTDSWARADSIFIFAKNLTAADFRHILGNNTVQGWNSSVIDFGKSVNYASLQQEIVLSNKDVKGRFCSYSDAAATTNEACSAYSNASSVDISGLTSQRYGRYYLLMGNGGIVNITGNEALLAYNITYNLGSSSIDTVTRALTVPETNRTEILLEINSTNVTDAGPQSATIRYNNSVYAMGVKSNNNGSVIFNVTVQPGLIAKDSSLVYFNITYNVTTDFGRYQNTTTLYNQTLTYAYTLVNLSYVPNVTELELQRVAFNLNTNGLTAATWLNSTLYLNNSVVVTNTSPDLTAYLFNHSFYTPTIAASLAQASVNLEANATLTFNGLLEHRTAGIVLQNITSLSVSNCTLAGTPEISFYLYQESNLAPVNASMDATFINWVTTIAVNKTVSFGLTGANAYHFCFNFASGNFFTDSNQVYFSANHATRNYFLLNQTFTAGQQNNISLYLLNATDSTNIIVTVTDNLDDPLSNHYVEVLRYYPDENVFRTVELARTDVNGEALLHLVALTGEEPFYQFIIKDQYGKVLKVTNPSKIVTSTINIQVLFQDEFIELLDRIDAISHTLTYNNNTGIATYFFSDANNIISKGIVEAKKITPRGTTILCHNEVESVSGTIYCDTGNATGNIIIQGTVILTNGDTELLTEAEVHTFENTMGNYGLILFIIELSMVSAAGLFHPAAGVLFGLFITVVNVILGILPFGWTTMMMFTILGGLIIVRLRT